MITIAFLIVMLIVTVVLTLMGGGTSAPIGDGPTWLAKSKQPVGSRDGSGTGRPLPKRTRQE